MSEVVSSSRNYWLAAAAMILVGFASSGVAFSRLPERIPTHWDINGEVNGYGSRWTLLWIPGTMVLMAGLFALMPWLSPEEFKVDLHRRVYLLLMLYTVGLFLEIEFVILYTTISGKPAIRAMVAGVTLFIVLLGNLLGKVDRNFFIGVRTPWTLASERVWIETHRLAAWMAVAGGGVSFVLALIPVVPLWLPFVVLMASVLYPVLHSLIIYKRLEKAGQLDVSQAGASRQDRR